MPNTNDPQPADLPALATEQLVNALHAGSLDPATLSVDDRRRCVENLTNQALTNAEIASVMRISPRTVMRDRQALRQAGCIRPDRALGDELLGEFERLSQSSIARLTRLARDESNPAYCRMWAEEAIVRIHQRYIDTARKLHYVEDGTVRLKRQREDDPAEQQRLRQRIHDLPNILGSL